MKPNMRLHQINSRLNELKTQRAAIDLEWDQLIAEKSRILEDDPP